MRVFKFFYLTIDFIKGNCYQWGLNPGFNDTEPYTFIVQAATTLDFSDIVYEINAGNSYFVIDNTNIKQNWSPDLYFRVQLKTVNNIYYSEILLFDSSPTTKRKYRMAADIMRKFNVWVKFAGTQAYLLKRKIYGTVDTKNVDPITGIPLNNNVGNFGTGIVGGYYKPLPLAMVIESNAKDKSLSPDGQNVKEVYELSVRINGFPMVDTYDVIVRADNNKRYNVVGIRSINFPGTNICIGQTLDIKLLPIGDNIYQIPTPSYRVPQLPLKDQPNV